MKQAGVGSRVISAMLEKTTPPAAPPAMPNAGGGNQPQLFDGLDDVRIVIDDKQIRLPANHGDLSTTGVWPVVFTFLDYPDLHARTHGLKRGQAFTFHFFYAQ